ncbi:MAG: metalloregulator ArsR/SmtB family transcription factor [Pseudomonadota bacterium]
MDRNTAAQGFSAMGSDARLSVLQILVKAGDGGLQVGDIQERSGIPASTLNHHLKALHGAGLIVQDRQGRAVINRANYAHLQTLAAFILEECCADEDPMR